MFALIGAIASTSQKSNFLNVFNGVKCERIRISESVPAFSHSLAFIHICRDYIGGPPRTPTHLSYLFCNIPHASRGRICPPLSSRWLLLTLKGNAMQGWEDATQSPPSKSHQMDTSVLERIGHLPPRRLGSEGARASTGTWRGWKVWKSGFVD